MIYWERVHPRFNIVLPRHGFYIWDWDRPEGWVEWLDYSQATVPQRTADQMSMAVLLRERLQPIDQFSSFLVIYSESGSRCSAGIITTTDTRTMHDLEFGLTAPAWWFYDEDADITTPMAVLLARVRGQIAAMREAFDVRPRDHSFLAPVNSGRPSGTHCPRCGLPYLKHVSHDIPGVTRPKAGPLEVWLPYLKAFREHYQAALKRLSDEEVLAMPMPTSNHYLKVLAVEVQRRIENPTPVKGRYDLLLEEDPPDE